MGHDLLLPRTHGQLAIAALRDHAKGIPREIVRLLTIVVVQLESDSSFEGVT